MAEQRHLGRDVFIALAAIGWADGNLDPEEADAIVRTAVEEGLDLEEIAEIEEATKKPVDIGFIDRTGMTKEDRLFVYAVASWMTRLDGVVSGGEIDALAQLGQALKIPERPRQHADAIAQEVVDLSEDDRPARYDLRALRTLIHDRLLEAQRLRAEAAAAEPPEADAADADPGADAAGEEAAAEGVAAGTDAEADDDQR